VSASKATAAKIDFKKEQKALYRPSANEIVKAQSSAKTNGFGVQ